MKFQTVSRGCAFGFGLWLLSLGAAVSTGSAFAAFPEAFPGSIWNETNHDFNNVEGTGNQGNLSQGIQWFSLPWEIPVVTYGSYRWRLRNQNQTYYDAHGPAAGVEFSKSFVRWGVEYEWQTYPKLDERTKNFSAYATWYKSFDFLGAKFPTSTWGRISDDFDHLEGFGTMGYVSQGIEWFKLPGDVAFRTLGLYRWRFRAKNKDYYNVHGPAAAVELGWKSANLGTEYAWQTYPELNLKTKDFRIYLSFYFDWDLKSALAPAPAPAPGN